MKQLAASLILILALAGCHSTNAPTPPLAPGFSSQADQSMDQVLVGARIFYSDIQQKVVEKTYNPAPIEKTALNTFATALNAAQIVYKAYHAGTATQAQAQAAVDSVASQQAALQTSLNTGAK